LPKSSIPEIRIRTTTGQVDRSGEFVLYWMIANRRLRYNFALQHAVATAKELNKPLIVLEALRLGYRWASDRIHWFVIQGMIDNHADFQRTNATYYPYLETSPGAGKGLLRTLAQRACLVVTDDFPCFFLPEMVEAAKRQIAVRVDEVDSNGLYPIRATDRLFKRAHDFRRHLQKEIAPHLKQFPRQNSLRDIQLPACRIPQEVTRRWPQAELDKLKKRGNGVLEEFPIDHEVAIGTALGGARAAGKQLRRFVEGRMDGYAAKRNQPEEDATSGLSPWLHFGHLSAHEVFKQVSSACDWSVDAVDGKKATGSSHDWWEIDPNAEAFLDELITWRELGYNFCAQRDDYDQYDSLPGWAKDSLANHAHDPRPAVYDLESLERAGSHDDLWNAAQQQLRQEGRIHNYLRMLWGKKILHWTESPQTALDYMIELNNKYALDGRNPNSYSGIFWCLGRYDRAWGPEREVFGKVRYMTCDSARRKFSVSNYIAKYNPDSEPTPPAAS